MRFLSTDMRQYRMRDWFCIVVSCAVAASLGQHFPLFPYGLFVLACTFWLGVLLLTLSDGLDAGPIDSRGLGSQSLNITGFLTVVLSLVLAVGLVVCNLITWVYWWMEGR